MLLIIFAHTSPHLTSPHNHSDNKVAKQIWAKKGLFCHMYKNWFEAYIRQINNNTFDTNVVKLASGLMELVAHLPFQSQKVSERSIVAHDNQHPPTSTYPLSQFNSLVLRST